MGGIEIELFLVNPRGKVLSEMFQVHRRHVVGEANVRVLFMTCI